MRYIYEKIREINTIYSLILKQTEGRTKIILTIATFFVKYAFKASAFCTILKEEFIFFFSLIYDFF